MTLHNYNPQPMSLGSINFLHLRFSRNSPDKILYIKVTTTRLKVKSRLHHDVVHLHHPTNVLTTYQLPTPHGFQDIARTSFSNSRSLRQGQRSTQGHYGKVKSRPIMTLNTYTPTKCPYQVSTSYTLRFLRYSLGKFFPLPTSVATHPPRHHG